MSAVALGCGAHQPDEFTRQELLYRLESKVWRSIVQSGLVFRGKPAVCSARQYPLTELGRAAAGCLSLTTRKAAWYFEGNRLSLCLSVSLQYDNFRKP